MEPALRTERETRAEPPSPNVTQAHRSSQALRERAGGGHFHFIGRPEQIVDAMTSELGELLEAVAREVWADVKHAPVLEIEPLSPVVAAASAPGELRLLVGDLVAGQGVELALAVRSPDARGTHPAAQPPAGAGPTCPSDRADARQVSGCSKRAPTLTTSPT